MEYCFVLQALNDGELLGQEASSIAHELMDTGDVGMEKFCILAGSGYKEALDHDEAANAFFMCVNDGLRMPGELTRVEMLFIITRNLNQLEQQKAAREGREYHDDYQMIYLQALQDKSVAAEVTYEEWLGDFATWGVVADKVAAVGVFGVAADLYGQGLTRDPSQYVFCYTIVLASFLPSFLLSCLSCLYLTLISLLLPACILWHHMARV
jgi:hypothetical protein